MNAFTVVIIDGINLFILECKYLNEADLRGADLVLIFSYWNVNPMHFMTIRYPDVVLIFSYWNVNSVSCPV